MRSSTLSSLVLRVARSIAVACVLLLAIPARLSAAPAPSPSPAPSASPAPAAPKASSDEDDLPRVNMYGPTVTNSATLTTVGLPEYELYYVVQNTCPAFERQRQSVYLVKYTFSNQWMISVGSNGFVRQDTTGGCTSDFASPQFTLKYLYKPPAPGSDAQALALVYKPPFGDPAKQINTGQPDYQIYWMYSRPIGECTLDANVWLSDLGIDGSHRRLTVSESASISVPVSDKFAYQGEVYHLGGNGPIPSIVSTLHGVTYEVSRSLSLGMAVDFGLNANAPRFNYVLGGAFFFGGGAKGKKASGAWNPMRQAALGAPAFGH